MRDSYLIFPDLKVRAIFLYFYFPALKSRGNFTPADRQVYRLIISLNFTVCLLLTSIFSPPFNSSSNPPLK